MPIREENRDKVKVIIVASCVAFAVLMFISLIISLISLAAANSRRSKLQAELDSINAKLQLNESNIDYYSSREFIESYVREYCDMQGKGEISFVGKDK